MRVYFLRHGCTDWNNYVRPDGVKDPKLQGRANIPLNDEGRRQAHEARKQLGGVKFDRVFCSPLDRARETLALAYDGPAPIIYDERILERDFGEMEGALRSELSAKDNFWQDEEQLRAKRVEPPKDFLRRVYSFIDDIGPNETVLVVAHGGVSRAFSSYFYGDKNLNVSNGLKNGAIEIFIK